MTRFRAFTIHLTSSILIFLFFLGLMFFVWYPVPYFEIDGGWKVLRILAGVDVVLGPLLTLIVFKPGKPSLKFDMSVIVLVQLVALLCGATIIYQQRPTFTVFGMDRFSSIPAKEVEFEKLKFPELKRTAGIGPLLAQARSPDDPKLRRDIMFGVLLQGQKDLEFRAEFYEPYRPDLEHLRARSVDLAKIALLDAQAKQAIDTFINRQGGKLEDYFYLPLRGRNKDIVMVISSKDGMPVGHISINPWISDYPSAP
ncbi:MAG: hypothetical protein IPP10_05550 [Candidatus Competibacteraceae bacterium]|nr:hypothetical protein [Candidatus Competibacteraceae bacterium]MBK7983493.1 hypothetical protein [Candidatus Competibacteraceae bacterium]MBK8897966.1 hypothetical protein [Candidatus Competibacteraceae bacterium]MBK8961770.1 hypothetical protein [Candidatus Competibacteraceae bacterium]MBK9950986.1 hypothetical protein [Candidatus Competibacteraceae bacterium]